MGSEKKLWYYRRMYVHYSQAIITVCMKLVENFFFFSQEKYVYNSSKFLCLKTYFVRIIMTVRKFEYRASLKIVSKATFLKYRIKIPFHSNAVT